MRRRDVIAARDAEWPAVIARQRCSGREGLVEGANLVGAEFDIERSQVLRDRGPPTHPDQRHDILAT